MTLEEARELYSKHYEKFQISKSPTLTRSLHEALGVALREVDDCHAVRHADGWRIESFIAYLRKSGHWGYVAPRFLGYAELLDSRRRHGTEQLRAFIARSEGEVEE